MKRAAYLCTIIFIACTAYLLQSCSSVPDHDYIHDYQRADKNSVTSASEETADLTAFKTLYENLDAPNLGELVKATYADTLYFNDTLNTYQSLDTLSPYLVQTGEHLLDYDFSITQSFQEGRDVFVKWTMDMTFKVMHKTIRSQSIGISQLRFNKDGKVIFHQDFWDSAEGIHKHMPYVGTWVKKVRNKL